MARVLGERLLSLQYPLESLHVSVERRCYHPHFAIGEVVAQAATALQWVHVLDPVGQLRDRTHDHACESEANHRCKSESEYADHDCGGDDSSFEGIDLLGVHGEIEAPALTVLDGNGVEAAVQKHILVISGR